MDAFNILNIAIATLCGTLPAWVFIKLICGSGFKRVPLRLMCLSVVGGLLSGCGLLIFKSFILPATMQPPTKEILTMTLFVSFVEAGLLEELFKNSVYILVLNRCKLRANSNRSTSSNTDHQYSTQTNYVRFAIGMLVGLGFALLENLWYATMGLGKWDDMLARMYTAVPAHIFIGGLFAQLLQSGQPILSSLIASICLHALYDFFTLPSNLLGTILARLLLVICLGFTIWTARKNSAEASSFKLSGLQP